MWRPFVGSMSVHAVGVKGFSLKSDRFQKLILAPLPTSSSTFKTLHIPLSTPFKTYTLWCASFLYTGHHVAPLQDHVAHRLIDRELVKLPVEPFLESIKPSRCLLERSCPCGQGARIGDKGLCHL